MGDSIKTAGPRGWFNSVNSMQLIKILFTEKNTAANSRKESCAVVWCLVRLVLVSRRCCYLKVIVAVWKQSSSSGTVAIFIFLHTGPIF